MRQSAIPPARQSPGQVITFYSFKGGTGRSMALANAACLLAERSGAGDVLIIDWDLEAPGIDRYFGNQFHEECSSGPDYWKSYLARPGLLDLFEDLQKQLTSGGRSDLSATQVMKPLELRRYLTRTDIARVWLMKAGSFGKEYARRVNTFQWEALYNASPDLFRAFAARLAEHFEFVLIDSRTGVTDTSGICTMLMPEKVVVVFTPNQQSLTGAADFVSKVAEYRRNSADVRPLTVYPLPSRIEPNEPDKKTWWRFGNEKLEIKGYEPTFEDLFREVYGLTQCNLKAYFDEVQIQYLGPFSYGEEIAVLQRSDRTAGRLSLSESYRRFLERLIDTPAPWIEPEKPPAEKAQQQLAQSRETIQQLEKKLASTYTRQTWLRVSVITLVALVISVLAIAIPAYRDYAAKAAVAEGVVIAGAIQSPMAQYYTEQGRFPGSIAELQAGRQQALNVQSRNVESIRLGPNGSIIATFREDLPNIGGKTFAFTPRVKSRNVIDWTCEGTVESKYLPSTCGAASGRRATLPLHEQRGFERNPTKWAAVGE